MTMNDSWGYQTADDDWKSPKTDRAQPDHLRARYRQLSAEYRAQGGWLDSRGVGAHYDRGGQVDGRATATRFTRSETCQPRRSAFASFTRKGNTLYMHVHFWPGTTVALGGLTE